MVWVHCVITINVGKTGESNVTLEESEMVFQGPSMDGGCKKGFRKFSKNILDVKMEDDR